MDSWQDISQQIRTVTQQDFSIKKKESISGGCINRCFKISSGSQHFFVKLNNSESLAMFEAEANGLDEIYHSHTIRVPRALCSGQNKQSAWLVLEYVSLHDYPRNNVEMLGNQLASMHRVTAKQYGWNRDNTIGSTPQINAQAHDWIDFWRNNRLGYQLQLAAKNGYRGKLQTLGEHLLTGLDHFFLGKQPSASLLHGDLWSGNYSFDESGDPVLFDPAVYYGDRETDIAMTELFGGFSADFYAVYRNNYPLDSEYKVRKIIYNLYHILNHLNLFGNGYRAQAEHMIATLLAEIRA